MKNLLVLLSLFTLLMFVATDSFARVGGGKSSGYRSYKSDRYSQPSQKQTQQDTTNSMQQPQQAQQPQRPSFFNSGLFKTIVGGLAIGALLSFLMGNGLHFGAPGLLEILLIGGLIFFIVRRFARARQSERLQYATNPGSASGLENPVGPEPVDAPAPAINETFIKDVARSTYKSLQDAWSRGDLSPVKNLLTERMYTYLNEQVQGLKAQGLRNVVEITLFQNLDVVEVDDEGDKKVVVVQIDTLLRDYTVDGNDRVVEGSRDAPAEAREYWAFLGKGLDWKLDDIKQA
jgi:predicted lipid-binding transport protein (Tim44 family)